MWLGEYDEKYKEYERCHLAFWFEFEEDIDILNSQALEKQV